MTDRMAALERVAEAASILDNLLHQENPNAVQFMAAKDNLSNAVDTLHALPAEPVGETVEVRGCAGINESGHIYGYLSSDENDDELRGQVESCGYEPTTMFTVRVPKSPPSLPTISAAVTTGSATDV